MKYRLFHLVLLECLNRQSHATLRQIKCRKMILNYVILLACALMVHCKNIPDNNTAIISTYAKVAHWGAVPSTTQKPQSEGRSHNGQTLWTHRSDVNIIGGQNLKSSKPSVVYQYPVQKVGKVKPETVPAVGEVQERFNPRPYFDYTQVPSKPKNDPKPKDSPPTPTFDSFPVFNKPQSPPPTDLYSSQYNSYNPPHTGPVAPPDDKPDVAYPPNGPPPPDNTDATPDDSNGYSYNPPQDTPPELHGPPAYPSLGPPLAPNDDHYPPNDNNGHKEQVYYPPSGNGDNGHQETILDHPPPGWEDGKDMGGPPAPPQMNGHDMAEHDLSPPPSPDFGGQFPQYLYNGPNGGHGHDIDYDFDHHHVYKEITTTEAPEDERVNKGHYSYYYLGRKLWYIPLYFSVYFIIYVTVLILKSIARHKIQFKHEHFHRDMSKDMDHHGRSLKIDELHENVTEGIEKTRRKIAFVAM
ncbi:uncharacterized protein LOC100142046 [Tribolium castaneum]|nr:PREDICTED: pollen-specific leucine-rich repeat extensin-like protein 1 [Tribolium castaneum]|eukprot:XP_001812159.2 PREDICTED: pollen-specific leucine-rich repeat extensin-like protein 1 [Tribolium castaneum]